LLQFKSRPSCLLAPRFLTAAAHPPPRQQLLTVRYTLWRQQTIAKENEISVTNVIGEASNDDVCGPAKEEVEKDVSHHKQNDGNEVVSSSSFSSSSSQQQEENDKNASSPYLVSSSHSNEDHDKKKKEEKEGKEQPPQNENPSATTTTSSSPANSGIIHNHGEKRPFDADATAVADQDDAAVDKHDECNCKEEPEAKKIKSPNHQQQEQQQEQESTMSSSSPCCSHTKCIADVMADRDTKEKAILLPVQQDHPVDKQEVGGHRGGADDDNDQDESPAATASTVTSEK
jgi:hypothetical protein